MVATLFADAELARPDAAPLEAIVGRDDGTPPQLIGCQLLDDHQMQRRQVGAPETAFRAFLDGKQQSQNVAFRRGLPIIASTVAAVVRTRRGRTAETWQLARETLLCAPFQLLGVRPPRQDGLAVIDLGDFSEPADPRTPPPDSRQSTVDGRLPSRHPLALARLAYHVVEQSRDKLEEKLALEWAKSRPHSPLLVDGSISRTAAKAQSGNLVGLVKSHRTMYLQNDEVETVLALKPGERSSALLIDTRNERVASWYLRLRREPGADPLWGLVRIEIPLESHSVARADQVSRWVLAETSPVSLPDSRWDRLIYGVRDCEMFLAAVM